MASTENQTSFTLNSAEKLILFEFLSRFSDNRNLLITDQAEEIVLNNILCQLEKQLSEPFGSDYKMQVRQALDKVRGGKQAACSCCGNYTIADRDIGKLCTCPVCYWKDDPIQTENPEKEFGANEPSLNQAKKNYQKLGVADKVYMENVRKPYFFELPANQK